MNFQESQLKDKRNELEGSKRGSLFATRGQVYSKYDAMQYIQNRDDDECTFQPKINYNSARISNRLYQPEETIADMLYRDAHERLNKEKEIQKTKNVEI